SIEIATQAEVNTGTDPNRAVTPVTLQGKLDPFITTLEMVATDIVATINPNGMSAVDITNIDTDELEIACVGVSHNAGSSANLDLSYSIDDGTTWVAWGTISQTAASAAQS